MAKIGPEQYEILRDEGEESGIGVLVLGTEDSAVVELAELEPLGQENDLADSEELYAPWRDDGHREVSKERYPLGSSTGSVAVLNFSNATVGAGVICMPFALLQCGLWTGVVMMCVFAYLSFQSLTMIVAAGETKGRLNYEELVTDIFGSAGTHTFCLFAGVLAFGAMCAYLIIAGDTVSIIALAMGGEAVSIYFADRSAIILMFGVVCALPPSLMRDMSSLSYVSSVSIAADVLLTLIVVVVGPRDARHETDIDRSKMLELFRPTMFAGFGIMCFCFGALTSAFLVYRSMAERGVQQWAWVTQRTSFIALAIAMALGLSGYLSFVDKTQGNILNNFPHDHLAANVARGLLAVTMVFTYPMVMYVARHVVDVSLFQTLMNKGQITAPRHYALTLGLWSLTMIVAMSTDDLGFILELIGAFGSSTLNFTMPGLLYIHSHQGQLRRATALWKKDSPEYEPALGQRLQALRKFFFPFVNILFGIVVMMAGVTTTVISEFGKLKRDQ